MPVPYNYAPGVATSASDPIVVAGMPWLASDSPLVIHAVRISDGAYANAGSPIYVDVAAGMLAVPNPWGAGVQARIIVVRVTEPVQELDWRNDSPTNVRDLIAQLDKRTTASLQEVWHFAFGNLAQASAGFAIASLEPFLFPTAEARRNTVMHFDAAGGLLLFGHQANKLVWYNGSNQPALTDITEFGRLLLALNEIDWDLIANKPTEFPPSPHTHPWGEVTGKPSTFPPSAHTHPVADISDSSALGRGLVTAADAEAARLLLEISEGGGGGGGGPVAWGDVTDKPATFPPSAHGHSWDEISDTPDTFPPSAHAHPAVQISDSTELGRSVLVASNAANAKAPLEVGQLGGVRFSASGSNRTLVVAKGGTFSTNANVRATTAYGTIEGAMAAAAAGDTILVYPGIYVEQVALKSGVALCGVTAFGGRAIIEQTTASAVVCSGTDLDGALLCDLTIRNNSTTNPALALVADEGTVQRCALINVSIGNSNAGAAMRYKSGVVPDVGDPNTLWNCYIASVQGPLLVESGGLQIIGCIIPSGGAAGGQILIKSSVGAGKVDILNCLFQIATDTAPINIESGAGANVRITNPAANRALTTWIAGAGAGNALGNVSVTVSQLVLGNSEVQGDQEVGGDLSVAGSVSGARLVISNPSSALTPAQSGALVLLSAGETPGSSCDLPAASGAAGCWFTIVALDDFDSGNLINSAGGSFVGLSTAAGVLTTPYSSLARLTTTIMSDGTNWRYVSGDRGWSESP